MKKAADIVIIGAGAAGLMAAAGAGVRPESKVIVLEKMPRAGRKIMITGKGRCNFTNLKNWNDFSGHIHPRPNFLKHAFYNLTSEKMMQFMEDYNLDVVVERGDRVFPASHRSADIVDKLVEIASSKGCEILYNKNVSEINKTEDTFRVETSDGDIFTCRKVIICTGGLSYPGTGCSGDGYRWAEGMEHTIKPTFPSLTAIVPKGYKIDGFSSEMKGHIHRETPRAELGQLLCGIQLKNVGLSVIVDGNEAQNEFGDFDFTDGGMEGPLGFKVSRKCVNAISNGSKVTVVIDMKPAVELEDLHKRVKKLWDEISTDSRWGKKQYKDRFRHMLTKLLPSDLIAGFMKCNPNIDHHSLAKALKTWKMDIVGFVGYERCVITAGGINTNELVSKTLESKLINGLYFAGEVLDLDGDTGGYNLQIAFSTGYLAGMSAAKSLD